MLAVRVNCSWLKEDRAVTLMALRMDGRAVEMFEIIELAINWK